jgi:hypothetical protein
MAAPGEALMEIVKYEPVSAGENLVIINDLH